VGREIPRNAFDGIVPQELAKGRNERLVIQPWVRNGYAYISLGIKDLQEDGTFEFTRRKGFALSVREAEEFVFKLATQVQLVRARMREVLDEVPEEFES
jgi:hypothetical protein